MAINQFPASSTRFGETLTSNSGVFTVDCSAGTDFNLNLNTSDLDQAFGFVNSSSANFGSATSGTLTLPSSMQGGDLVIVAVGSDGSKADLPSGWIQIDNTTSGTAYQRTFYKIMETTPDSSVSITGISTASVAVAMAFRDVSFESYAVATTATTGLPNPPSVTTTTNNSIVVAVGFIDDDNVTLTVPSGYSNLVSQSASTTGFTTAMATKLITSAGAEDPAAFGGTGDDDTIALSIVLAPISSRATINVTNIPNEIKEFKIYGYRENTNSLKALKFSWDTDIIQVSPLIGAISNNFGISQTFFSYNGVLYSYNPPHKIQHVDYIKTTQTWICPSDVTFVEVLLCGGGGGGDNTSGEAAGGGSVTQDSLSVIPGQIYTITIGAGGAVGNPGSAGSTSSFGPLLSLAGGAGGSGNSFTVGAGFGGFGGYGTTSATTIYNGTGISGYGDGGSAAVGVDAPVNSGRGGSGGNGATNGGSGVCIIKYWSAY